jgi:2-oxoglutarate dehydrogenase E1 component
MTTGTFFQRVILEGARGDNMSHFTEDINDNESIKKYELLPPSQIRRVIFCCGKIFYHLYHARQGQSIKDIYIIRVEQLAPFPYDLISSSIKRFPNADLIWCQEEPKNQGAWTYVKPRFDTAMRESGIREITYIGRKPSSAAAVGNYHIHDLEQKNIIREALSFT